MIRKLRFQQRSFLTRRALYRERRKFILTLIFGAVIFYLLIFQFIPLLIGSLTFLNKLKPSGTTQAAVVEDSTIAPPFLNIPFESTNNSTIKVSGYAQPNAKVEIYVDGALSTTAGTDSGGNFISDNITLSLGNNQISGKTVQNGRRSLSSKPINVYYSNTKPKLEINSPADNQVVEGDKKVTVSGTTNPDGINITVNGVWLIVDSSGNFYRTFDLQEGDNNFTIIATDNSGNTTKISRKVIYHSPTPTPAPSPTPAPTPTPEVTPS